MAFLKEKGGGGLESLGFAHVTRLILGKEFRSDLVQINLGKDLNFLFDFQIPWIQIICREKREMLFKIFVHVCKIK